MFFYCLDNGFINITISEFNDKANNGQAVSKIINLNPKSVSTIQIENIPVNVTYLIIQVHAHEENIIIEHNETDGNQTEVQGSNIGFVLNPQEPRTIIKNKNDNNISVLIAVVYYLSQGNLIYFMSHKHLFCYRIEMCMNNKYYFGI